MHSKKICEFERAAKAALNGFREEIKNKKNRTVQHARLEDSKKEESEWLIDDEPLDEDEEDAVS